MDLKTQSIHAFLASLHPYDSLPPETLAEVVSAMRRMEFAQGALVYVLGAPIGGLYLIKSGAVEVSDGNGALVSLLGPRNSFGERGLLRDGIAATQARAVEPSVILCLPAPMFRRLLATAPAFARFFRQGEPVGAALAVQKLADMIARPPLTCPPETTAQAAAQAMVAAQVSSLAVVDAAGALCGLLTTASLAREIVALGRPLSTPVAAIMRPDPVTLPPEALGADVLQLMFEHRIAHVPIVAQGRLLGMVTQTDLTRFAAVSALAMVQEIAQAETLAEMAQVSAQIPRLLGQLMERHVSHEVATRLITDIADAVTRRLLVLGEAQFGAAPQPYVWLACGSQGRQEQSAATDQDNCLLYHDAASAEDAAYFAQLARFVCEGLAACGYAYCPGEMMAMTPRWCQPARVWRQYFSDWVRQPDGEAQMLASVMFDLRAVAGDAALYEALQAEMLAEASGNAVFVAHMLGNALKHVPPLGLLRGFATIRSGEHRNQIDLKMNGVVPVVDLGRIYALQGQIAAANTRARLVQAEERGLISAGLARDLIEAYDLIATLRLTQQSRLLRAGRAADNYLAPADLSDLERSHLRNAFVVVRGVQSVLAHSKAALR